MDLMLNANPATAALGELALWVCALAALAVAFVLLLRCAAHAANQEHDNLNDLLAQAREINRGYEQREQQHLAEIARLRRRLQNLQDMDHAA